MKQRNKFIAYLLIGIGLFFLLRELRVPIITNFYSWQTLFIIIGVIVLIYALTTKKYQHLFIGTIILGLGIHFHGISNYSFWIDHWAVYPLIIGIAFIVRYIKTKDGLLPGSLLCIFPIVILATRDLAYQMEWVHTVYDVLDTIWPLFIILIGIFLLRRK